MKIPVPELVRRVVGAEFLGHAKVHVERKGLSRHAKQVWRNGEPRVWYIDSRGFHVCACRVFNIVALHHWAVVDTCLSR